MDKCFDGRNCGEGGFCDECPILKITEIIDNVPEEFPLTIYENLEDLQATSEKSRQLTINGEDYENQKSYKEASNN